MSTSPDIHLRLFGSPSLEREDGSVLAGRAAQRHRLALLALLALAPGHRISRDKLMAWLWPEADGKRARNLLNVSTHVLRGVLGETSVVSAGEDVRLDATAIRPDVVEFQRAMEAGDEEAAVALYRGPFLDGFFLPEADEFDQWSGRERQRLSDAYGKALEGLAERAEAAGDFGTAAVRWRARAAHDPLDSRVALRLMQALDASGNRAAAIQHAAAHTRLLNDELGTSAPEVVALSNRLRDDPRPQPLPERPLVARTAPEVLPTPPAPEAARPRQSRLPRWASAAALAVAALSFTAWLALARAPDADPSIVVLPFANLAPDRAPEYLSDGLTDEIIAGLATVPRLTVIARNSADRYASSVATLPEIARELGVSHVLHGTLRPDGDQVQVTARLVATEGERVVWAQTYDAGAAQLARIQDDIAHDVVRALRLKLVKDSALVQRGTRNAEAYELYRRGRFHWATRTLEGHQAAIAYFERAIALDSSYADAYAALADAHLTSRRLGMSPYSEEEAQALVTRAAERALALDDGSADAHNAFANVLWWQKNWPGAERELRRALELNPNHAGARHFYALLLHGMGRQQEALREARRAAELDPFAMMIVMTHGFQCYVTHDLECALEQFDRVIELNPQWGIAIRRKAIVQATLGQHAEAQASMRQAHAVEPDNPQTLIDRAIVLALSGDTAAARAALRTAGRPAGATGDFNLARAYSTLGDRDSAFAALERHEGWLWPGISALADPLFDPLRADPRFVALEDRVLREMGVR